MREKLALAAGDEPKWTALTDAAGDGDGVGLGKGRQLAGIVYDNWLRGRRRHLWVSVSADLCVDGARVVARGSHRGGHVATRYI